MLAFFRRHRWWLLLLIAVAGLASWYLWPKSGMWGLYDRIRIGMTQAEVSAIMGTEHAPRYGNPFEWEFRFVANEPPWNAWHFRMDDIQRWSDGSREVAVYYQDRKTSAKTMRARMTPFEMKRREWLNWLRGVIGLG